MKFHPKDLPVSKTYDLKDEKDASDAVADMVKLGFKNRKDGFRILMPKETKLAKRMGIYRYNRSYTWVKTNQSRKRHQILDISP